MDFFQSAASHAPAWSGYTLLLFVEASLGKTKYGSVMGLVIAAVKGSLNLVSRILFRALWKEKHPPCGKEHKDDHR